MTTSLALKGIRKSFDGVVVLDDAEFSGKAGEVHALLGENGAGKSSLMNVAAGLYAPEAGHIFINGEPVALSGPAEARAYGIGMVHQHFKLVMPFTVAENILLANRTSAYRAGIKEIRAAIKKQSDELGFDARSRPPHRYAVGGAAAAGRDRQGAGRRRQNPDPRRADRGVDRRRGGAIARHRAAAGARRHRGGPDHPQAQRSEALRRCRHHHAPRQDGGDSRSVDDHRRRTDPAHGRRDRDRCRRGRRARPPGRASMSAR